MLVPYSRFEDFSRLELVEALVQGGVYHRAAGMVRAYDALPVALIDADDRSVFEAALREKGFAAAEVDGTLYIDHVATCLYCRQEHSAGDHECVGATPVDEMPEDDSAALCQICLGGLSGPPSYCCDGRKRLYERLHGNQRILACDRCHGLGVLGGDHRCDACGGSGVA